MKKENWLTGLYRSGVLAGILAVMWMQSHFITKNENNLRWENHDELRDNLLVELRTSIRDAKDSIQRVEIKLDNILRQRQASVTNKVTKG